MEVLQKLYGALRSVMEYYRVLQDITKWHFGDRTGIGGFSQLILRFLLALKPSKSACNFKVCSDQYGITNNH